MQNIMVLFRSYLGAERRLQQAVGRVKGGVIFLFTLAQFPFPHFMTPLELQPSIIFILD